MFERHIKNRITAESISLPEIPAEVMARYPGVVESINKLEAEGFPIFAYDGSSRRQISGYLRRAV